MGTRRYRKNFCNGTFFAIEKGTKKNLSLFDTQPINVDYTELSFEVSVCLGSFLSRLQPLELFLFVAFFIISFLQAVQNNFNTSRVLNFICHMAQNGTFRCI